MTYTPDAATSTVIATVSVNLVIGSVAYLCFEYFRSRGNDDLYAPRMRAAKTKTPPMPPRGWFAWITATSAIDDEETIRMIGLDAYIFLRFLRLCASMCVVCAMYGLVVLFPVYSTAPGNDGVAGINLYTMANVESGGMRLWVSLISCWMFNLYFLWMLRGEYEEFVYLRQNYLRGAYTSTDSCQTHYSVLVENIPNLRRSPQELRSVLEEWFPGDIHSTSVVLNTAKLEKRVAERETIVSELENNIAKFKASNLETRPKTPTTKNISNCCGCFGEKVDAIEHYSSQLASANADIKHMKVSFADAFAKDTSVEKQSFRGLSSGTGFVTFTKRKTQTIACQLHLLSDVHSDITMSAAPEPSDIIWENVGVNTSETEHAKVLTRTLFTSGALFWAAVLAFIAAISNLENLQKYLPFIESLDDVTYSLLAGILPVVVMAIFIDLLPTIFSTAAVKIERRKRWSDVQTEVMRWFFAYQLANVYLTLLSGSAFNALSDALSEPASIVTLLGAALPSVSVFFLNYVLSSALSALPLQLLRPQPLAIFYLYRYFEKYFTLRNFRNGPLSEEEINYGVVLPGALFTLCIVLTYWVIAPVLLIAGGLYFVGTYVVMKYQYLYLIQPKFESGGKFWYLLYYYTMLGLLVSSITMIGYFALKEGAAQSPLLLPLPFVIVHVWRDTEGKYERLSADIALSKAIVIDAVSNEAYFKNDFYTQPCLKEEDDMQPQPYRIESNPIIDMYGRVSECYVESD